MPSSQVPERDMMDTTSRLYSRLETYIQTEIESQNGADALSTVRDDMNVWFETNIAPGINRLDDRSSRIAQSLNHLSFEQMMNSLARDYSTSAAFTELQRKFHEYLEQQSVRYFGKLPDWFVSARLDLESRLSNINAASQREMGSPDARPSSGSQAAGTATADETAPLPDREEIPTGELLINTIRPYITRMESGESLVRIGPMWYGENRMATVPNVSYFSGKQVDVIPVLRAEAAAAFSSSRPPVDKITVELVVHYSHFKSHVQRLIALSQVAPVVPVMNPLIAALTQPIDTCRDVYVAYGFQNAAGLDITHADNTSQTAANLRAILLNMYSSVPIQMKIDAIRLESIRGASRDIRVLVTMTRVLTSNSYGDKTQYVKTLTGARDQHAYINSLIKPDIDQEQISSIAKALGINFEGVKRMIDALKNRQRRFEGERWLSAQVIEILSGSTLIVQLEGRTARQTITLAGVKAPECSCTRIGHTRTEPFGFASRNKLRSLLQGHQIKVIRRGTEPASVDDTIICQIRYGDEVATDPIVTMVREGMLLYSGENLLSADRDKYAGAYEQARAANVGVHSVPYFRRATR